MENDSPRRHALLKENLNTRHGIASYDMVRETPDTPKTIQAIAVALACPPKLSSKTLLLKPLYTLVAGHRDIKVELSKTFWLMTSFHSGGRLREEKASTI